MYDRNALIADRLDAFAALLDLAEANGYTVRAYRRAAATIRGVTVPVADLVRSGRVRELRGIGPGIEARLRELLRARAARDPVPRHPRSPCRTPRRARPENAAARLPRARRPGRAAMRRR